MERCGLKLYLNPVGFIDWCLIVRQSFEPDVKQAIQGILHDGGIMLDIGANMGVFSIEAAKIPGVSVYAFEPSPRELERLHLNISLNPDAKITVLPYACSSKAETHVLYQASTDNPGANSMAQEPDTDSFQEIQIQSIVPHEVLNERVFEETRLVKIDVEGYEYEVIKGLQPVLPKLQKASFIVEINPPCLERAGSSVEELYSLFASDGFEPLLGTQNGRKDADGKYDEVFFSSKYIKKDELLKRIGWQL